MQTVWLRAVKDFCARSSLPFPHKRIFDARVQEIIWHQRGVKKTSKSHPSVNPDNQKPIIDESKFLLGKELDDFLAVNLPPRQAISVDNNSDIDSGNVEQFVCVL